MKHGAEGTHFACNHRPTPGCCGCDPCESCKHATARSFAELYREAEAGKKLREAWNPGWNTRMPHEWTVHLMAYDESIGPKE